MLWVPSTAFMVMPPLGDIPLDLPIKSRQDGKKAPSFQECRKRLEKNCLKISEKTWPRSPSSIMPVEKMALPSLQMPENCLPENIRKGCHKRLKNAGSGGSCWHKNASCYEYVCRTYWDPFQLETNLFPLQYNSINVMIVILLALLLSFFTVNAGHSSNDEVFYAHFAIIFVF